ALRLTPGALLNAGDPDPRVGLVAAVDRDEVGGEGLDLVGVAQASTEDAAYTRNPVGQGTDHVGGGTVLTEDEHVQVHFLDLGIQQHLRGHVVEGGGDPAVDQDLLRLLCGTAFLDLQGERATLVETQRVDAVHDDLAGERFDELLQQLPMPLPRHGHDDDVTFTGGRGVVQSAHIDRGGFGRHQFLGGRGRTLGAARADMDGVSRQGQAAGQAATLITRTTEDGDGQL